MESILSLGPLLIPIVAIAGGCAVAITVIVGAASGADRQDRAWN